METGRKKKWSRIIAMMLAMVMIMQNVVSVGAAVDFSQHSGNFDENTGGPQGPDGNDGGGSESGELFSDDNFSDTNSTNPENDGTGDGTPEGDTSSGETDINGNEVPEVRQVINSVASQRVIQMTDSNNVTQTYIRYQVDVTNESEIPVVEFKTDEEMQAYEAAFIATTDVKILLPETLSYAEVSDEANTEGMSTFSNPAEAAAVLNGVDASGYAGPVYAWTEQSLNVSETKSFVAYAQVAQGVTDSAALTAAIYANGQYTAASWMDTELLANNTAPDAGNTEENDSLEDGEDSVVVVASQASQSVQQYTEEDGEVDTYIRYQINIENTSTDTTAENTEVRLELPSTLIYAQYPEAADETAGIAVDGQTISWIIESLEAQGQMEFVCYALAEKGATTEADITATAYVNGEAVELGALDVTGIELLAQNMVKADTSVLDEVIERNKEKDNKSPLLGVFRSEKLNGVKGIDDLNESTLLVNLTGAHSLDSYLKSYMEDGKSYDGIELSTYQSLNNGWITLSMHMEETEGDKDAQFPIYYDTYTSSEDNVPKGDDEKGWLYYNLGELVANAGDHKYENPLIITETQAGSIVNKKNKDEVLGDYIISTDGMLLIRFSESVGGNRDTCTADLQFNAKYNLSQITEDTVINISFKEDINKEISIKPGLGITASKQASPYDRIDGTFTFTIGLDVEVGTTSAITMTDTMDDYLEYVGDSLKVFKLSGESGEDSTEISSEQWTITPDGSNKFTLVFKNGLEQGNYNIVYKVKLTQGSIDETNGEFASQFMSNKAVFTIGNNTERKYEVVGEAQYSHYWVQKSAGNFENGKIPWTIRINSNAEHATRGMTVTDTLQSYKLNYYQGLPVSVTKKYYDGNNSLKEDSSVSLIWGEDIIVAEDGRSWTYTIPESDPEKCEYLFTFYTTAQKPTGDSEAYANEASFNGHDAMDYITISNAQFGVGSVTKKGGEIVEAAGNRYKTWTTTITIPNGIKNAVYTDTLYGSHVFNAPLRAVGTNSSNDGKYSEILVNGAVGKFELQSSTDKSFVINLGDYSQVDNHTVVTLTYYSKITGNGSIINLAEINLDDSLITDADSDEIREYNISKSGRFDSTTGLINWTVNLGSGFGSQPVTIRDTFKNQEYIAGSARISDRTGKSPYIFPGYPKVEGNTLVIYTILSDPSQTYTLTYQTRPISSTEGTPLIYSNQAKVYDSENKEIATTKDVDVKVPNQVFDKSETLKPTQDNEYKATYKMVVNESGISYGNVSTEYTIDDMMGSNMEMDTNSLKIYTGKLENPDNLLTVDKDYDFSYKKITEENAEADEKNDIGKKRLVINIPGAKNSDGTGKTFLICYDVKIIRTQNGNGTEHASYENKAILTIDGKDIHSETTSEVDILAEASAGGEYTDKYITIAKYAENGRTRLPGATFALYRKSASGEVELPGLEGTWEFLERKTTESDETSETYGTIYFGSKNRQDDPGYNFLTDDVLALVEETSPEGYQLITQPFIFTLANSALHNDDIYTWGEEYRVTNEPYSLKATKRWSDNSNHDGKREQIWLQLFANEEEIGRKPVKVDISKDTWSYTWEKLLERDSEGELINYVVKEGTWDGETFKPLTKTDLESMGYTSDAFVAENDVQTGVAFADGEAVITNTHELEKVSYKVTKKWDDEYDISRNRPSSVTLNLYQVISGEKQEKAYNTIQLGTGNTETSISQDGATWSYEWTNLPKYANGGAEITYAVEEVIPTGYVQDPEPDVRADETIITNKLNLYTDIHVEKEWVDNGNSAGIQPQSIQVRLEKKIGDNGAWDITGAVLTLNKENEWKGKWENLVTKQDGKDVFYRVIEVQVPAGYQATYPDPEKGSYSFKIVNTLETVNIKAIKKWEDSGNQDKVRPDSITFVLKANNVEKGREKVDSKNSWSHTWKNLNKYADGNSSVPIVYTVEEVVTQDMTDNGYVHTSDDGVFETEINTWVFTHTNSREINTRDIFVKKVWQDSDNQDGKRPTAINVELQVNGKPVSGKAQVTLNDENEWGEDWKQGWTELPVNDANGNAINYQVAEVSYVLNGQTYQGVPTGYTLLTKDDDGYIEPEDGKFTLTNAYATETVTKSVEKIWDDGDDADAKRPDGIGVQLFKRFHDQDESEATAVKSVPANGESLTEVLGFQTLTDNENKEKAWKFTWNNLPKYEEGKELVYSVKEGEWNSENTVFTEKAPKDYTETYDFGNKANSESPFNKPKTTITNKYDYVKTTVMTYKIWDDDLNGVEDNDGVRPAQIKVMLTKDGMPMPETAKTISQGDTVKVNGESVPWSAEWTGLPANERVGVVAVPIEYGVIEFPHYTDANNVTGNVAIVGYETKIEKVSNAGYGFRFSITNTHVPETTEKKVTKRWSDNGNQDNVRPEQLHVALYQQIGEDGEETLYDGPDAVKILKAEDGVVSDIWKDEWTNLPVFRKDADNVSKKVIYTVKEGHMVFNEESKADEFKEYTAEDLEALGYKRVSADGSFTIENKHETKKIKVFLFKNWVDDVSVTRPEKIKVELWASKYDKESGGYKEVKVRDAIEVTGDGDVWGAEWTNLDRMHNGKEVIYYAKEVGDLNGYTFTTDSKAENGSAIITVTNKNTKERNVTVNKVWDDDKNRDGKRPESISYKLYADGHIYDEKTVTEVDGWTFTWNPLPYYREDGTTEIVYTVEENMVVNYKSSVTPIPVVDEDGDLIFTATNTYKPETTSKTVTKEWQDDGDRDSLRGNAADTLYVQLYANGEIFEDAAPVKLDDFIKGNGDEESKWTHTWDELPRYYRDEEESKSEEIVYTVQEGFVDEAGVFAPCTEEQLAELGYSRITDTDDPMLIINKHDNELTEVRVKKKWEDNDNFDSLRRDIVIQLYSQIDGEQEKLVKEETLKLGTLTHTWDNLPVYENGQKITYSVKEIMPDEIVGEYVSEIAVKEPTEEDNVWKFTVTNTHDQITIEKSVKKNWSDNDDQDKIRPEYIEVQLMADGEAVNEDEKIRLSEQNEWYHEWTNLPKNKVVEGETVEIQYSVKELNVPEGYEETIIENESKTGFVIDNKHQTDKTGYSVVKYWVDNNDPERPKEVKFQLYANKYNKEKDTWKKEAVDKPAAFTGTSNTWSYTWKNLDVMSGGKEIEYSVEEVDVATGYVVTYDRHDTMTIATNTKTTTEFSKTDITGTQELAGATLQVWSGDGKSMIEEWKSTTTPHIIRGKLEAGKQYILKEALAPAGYAVADPVTFLVNSDGRIQTVVMKDAKTNISILKVDDNKKPLAGAELAIKDSKGTVIEQWTSTDKAHVIEGKLIVGQKYTLTEVKAPLTYFLAKDIAFTVPSNGIVELTMVDSQEEAVGKISATKKVTAMVDNELVEHKVASDATYYMALFKDAAGKERYTEYGIKEVVVKKDSSVSEAVTWEKLPSGTYYVFETNKNGTAIPLGERQNEKDADGNDYSYTCVVAGGTTNMVELAMQEQKVEGKINLENAYYELPSGYRYFGEIHINKKVLRNGSAYDTNTEFYAGIFTKDEAGDLVAADLGDQASVVKLTNNGTVTVEVPLGGENQDGAEPITYYVMETDKYGDPLDTDVFAYEISGEGEVTLTQEVTEGTVTITNEVKDNTMELDVLKVDENDNPLAGAAFILTYREANVTAGKWTSTTAARTLTLIPGTYTLSELQAPTGYIKGSDATITIAEDGTVKVSGDDISYKNGIVRFVNKKSTTTTQSSGTTTKTSTTSGGSSTSGGGATNTVYKAGSVKTGDETPIALYLLILAGAVAIAGSVIFIKKRKSSK